MHGNSSSMGCRRRVHKTPHSILEVSRVLIVFLNVSYMFPDRAMPDHGIKSAIRS